MSKRKRPEDDIQRAVFQHLGARGAPGIVAWHTPNGGGRSAIEASILKGLGVRSGMPDICILRERQLYVLELKAVYVLKSGRRRKGVVSPEQAEMLAALARAGAIVGTAWGLDDALAWLESHGLLLRDVGRRQPTAKVSTRDRHAPANRINAG